MAAPNCTQILKHTRSNADFFLPHSGVGRFGNILELCDVQIICPHVTRLYSCFYVREHFSIMNLIFWMPQYYKKTLRPYISIETYFHTLRHLRSFHFLCFFPSTSSAFTLFAEPAACNYTHCIGILCLFFIVFRILPSEFFLFLG